jgi:uncharacterized protein YceK
MMHSIQKLMAIVGLVALLTFSTSSGVASASDGFNDEYVFAATRSVSHMDANPALKVTLYPLTVVVDAAFLPFAVVAGFVTG